MKCTQCGYKNDMDAQYCIRCGIYLRDSMFCRYCGTQLNKRMEHCPNCQQSNPMFDANSSSFASKVIAAENTFSKIMIPFAILFLLLSIFVVVLFIILVMNMDTSVFSY